jgi:hypothetical protein
MDRVLVIPVPQFGEGARVIYSAAKKKAEDCYGGEIRVKNNFSFCFINGDYAAEWEPEYGPIQVWHKCEKDDPESRPHYIFDFTDSGPLNWSQLAVDKYELPSATNNGQWQYIFNVLKDWANK